MQPTLRHKLEELVARREEVGLELADPEVIQDQPRFRRLSQEYSRLESLAEAFTRFRRLEDELVELQTLEQDNDPEVRALADDELPVLEEQRETLERELKTYLLPHDPRDRANLYLEIRAGTGGDEAALFAGDLFRMYYRYAESRGWRLEVLSESAGEHGGYKEIILRVVGEGAFSRLKFESGGHRVQRVPQTESQGRIHTSACTVAVLPEMDEIEEIEINPADLRTDTYRASGAGGQHVNKTDSAVRITHLPTGIVVECQDERSQHKNRARALSLLRAKLLDQQRERQQAEQTATRRLLVGSGDRSERIRTYNFPQGRVTDHRINLTLYKLEAVLQGDLDEIIDALIAEDQADQLAALGAA